MAALALRLDRTSRGEIGRSYASGLLAPEEVSAIDEANEPETPERPDWVKLIGSRVTSMPEFSYGTIARPIRP
jgi:hypothetical protein